MQEMSSYIYARGTVKILDKGFVFVPNSVCTSCQVPD